MSAIPIAIFASGRGSNFEALAKSVASSGLSARITALVSDRADAPALQIADRLGVRTHVVMPPVAARDVTPEARRREHEQAIMQALEKDLPSFIVLAGYMRVLGGLLLGAFRSPRGYARVVNIHPSLLPAFPGRDSYGDAFRHGVKLTGATVHLVDASVDTGPICAQDSFSIEDCRTVEEVRARGLEHEHRLYPRALQWILPEKFDIEGDRHVRPH